VANAAAALPPRGKHPRLGPAALVTTALHRLAALHGIARDYHDIWGALHRVSDDTLRALLSTMGVDPSTDEAVEKAIVETTRLRWQRVIDAATVIRDGTPLRVTLRLPTHLDQTPLRWRIIAEDGDETTANFDPATLPRREAMAFSDVAYIARDLTLGVALGRGYHRFVIFEGDAAVGEGLLIVTPSRCYLPSELADNGRAWGVAAQLYGLRSARNWGSGDFSDLRMLVDRCARAGASVVGVNPLHARAANNPAEASPYAASSRLFVDPQYLDVKAIADFEESDGARAIVGAPRFQATLRALRDSELIDRAGTAAARNRVLEMLYANFRLRHLASGSARADQFRRFCAEGGDALRRYALFEALQEHFDRAVSSGSGWLAWPKRYRDPASPDAAQFFAEHIERVEFFAYLQWQADLQLAAACGRVSAPALSIGLYRDLAVSVDRGGAEAWTYQHCYALGASVGAPPDDFSLFGQDWGIAPWIPSRLADAAYEPFIALLRANMRHAGALRIDHVMGLTRLFWIAVGGVPADGAYVGYPLHALLGIVALESQRNRCLIIGEDLGTVPDDVRIALNDAGVLSYDVFYFERRSSGEFKSPSEYAQQAIAVASTHDLPTLAGWWEGRDLALRDALGLFPTDAERDRQHTARAQDRAQLLIALDQAKLKPQGMSLDPSLVPAMTRELARAVHVYLARTPAELMVGQLEDVVGMLDQTNLPGTTTEHPNWRRKLILSLEQLQHDARFDDLAAALRRERPLRH
jgi:(1->4)-alpha-D-glucan 1-alpha-D-glucosylmutase